MVFNSRAPAARRQGGGGAAARLRLGLRTSQFFVRAAAGTLQHLVRVPCLISCHMFAPSTSPPPLRPPVHPFAKSRCCAPLDARKPRPLPDGGLPGALVSVPVDKRAAACTWRRCGLLLEPACPPGFGLSFRPRCTPAPLRGLRRLPRNAHGVRPGGSRVPGQQGGSEQAAWRRRGKDGDGEGGGVEEADMRQELPRQGARARAAEACTRVPAAARTARGPRGTRVRAEEEAREDGVGGGLWRGWRRPCRGRGACSAR